jgi:cellulose synthase/poly-beta-1,6-N-acetylglucosamine synthase-like glycosyltransferase
MDLLSTVVLVLSVLVVIQSLFGLYLTLYAWEHPDLLEASRRPARLLLPKHSFTALLPARHEEAVIYETVRRIAAVRYPKHLREIIVICHEDDVRTIAEAQRAQRDIGDRNIKVLTFRDDPINKPHGLNVGLAAARRQFVTIFDAEDDVHPDLFRLVNTILVTEKVRVVQAGVQLMNFRDRWFSIHNCLEYYFWFKSRLHYHARVGMVPLGGNTVFMRRELMLEAGGWDENCLTEDADIGIRLSAMGEPIRVIYEPEFVTREETPDSVGSWIRQRTRWNQGFIYLLRKGSWLHLPRFGQRMLALYTLAYPMLQALLFMLWPTVVIGAILLKVPIPVALVSFVPLYVLLFQLVIQLMGAVLFASEFRLRLSPLTVLSLAVTFLLYQWMLGISALRAVYRELEIQLGWEKTHHAGAHRRDRSPTAPLRPSPMGIMNTIGHAPMATPLRASSGERLRHCVRCGVARSWRELVCPACGASSARAS